MKLFAEIVPLMCMALRPISLAYSKWVVRKGALIQINLETYEELLDLALTFVHLPVLNWQDFEVLEHVNVGMLPQVANCSGRRT